MAGTPHFKNAANDYLYYHGADQWLGLVQKLEQHGQQYGRVSEIYIFDHGTNDATSPQMFGDYTVTVNMFSSLSPYLAADSKILLGGCCVGANADYCNAIADAIGAKVVATASEVSYRRYELYGIDYKPDNNGIWIIFPGTANGAPR